jgi:hypothetical protein
MEWSSTVNRKVFMPPYSCAFSITLLPGVVKKVHRGRVAVFTSGVDIAQTETKGTVLLHNAEEMLNFTTGEEKHLEKVSASV